MRFSCYLVVCAGYVDQKYLFAACNHPSLVNKDYQMDSSPTEPRAASKADDDGDDVAAMFGSLGVSNAGRCQVCQIECVLFVIL